MKSERSYCKVNITKKGSEFVESHPWLFAGEVVSIDGEYHNGDIVDVISHKGKYIGSGFINDQSKIFVRIFCRNASDTIDEEFFKRRLSYSWQYRKDVMQDTSNCRVVFGEADGLPGLTIDKYNDILVAQITCLGMEQRKEGIYQSLVAMFEKDSIVIKAIYQRDDVSARKQEGLVENSQFVYKREDYQPEQELIDENGIKYYVDYIEGQKTGFFLDQKDNRLLVRNLVKGKRVLDCFCHTGSFALNAVKGEAKYVRAVDISNSALLMAKKNCEVNKMKIDFVEADVFEYLKQIDKKSFDVIILDPPAFTKGRDSINNGLKGYQNINAMAMSLLGKGGYLVTCSCSHFVTQTMFEDMLLKASQQVNVELKQISYSQQAKDHPILLNVNETRYLKFYILQIV